MKRLLRHLAEIASLVAATTAVLLLEAALRLRALSRVALPTGELR